MRKLMMIALLGGMSLSGWAGPAPSIEATLNAHAGKAVTLKLADGSELGGRLDGVSPVTVKLIELSGKEYYEAVIRLDQISAVIVRSPGK